MDDKGIWVFKKSGFFEMEKLKTLWKTQGFKCLLIKYFLKWDRNDTFFPRVV